MIWYLYPSGRAKEKPISVIMNKPAVQCTVERLAMRRKQTAIVMIWSLGPYGMEVVSNIPFWDIPHLIGGTIVSVPRVTAKGGSQIDSMSVAKWFIPYAVATIFTTSTESAQERNVLRMMKPEPPPRKSLHFIKLMELLYQM